MNAATDSSAGATRHKPRFSFAIASALGLGYLKPGPGTWGSLAGVVICAAPTWVFPFLVRHHNGAGLEPVQVGNRLADPFVAFEIPLAVFIAVLGLLCADRVSRYSAVKDPQFVVIDEVSGQQLTLLLGGFVTRRGAHVIRGLLWANHPLAVFGAIEPNWKYLLLGFILFRAFDIWKPVPARQAESLPGGLGVMADDWIAAIYAAAVLSIARWFGL
jgi:phosphatidylglycerophosphatase A